MWFFSAPRVVYGEEALTHLAQIRATRALIVTDPTLHQLGFSRRVQAPLESAGVETAVFAEVEPEPSLQTVQRGARCAADFGPDLIVGLGGGSAMDAAKAIWLFYERPDLDPEAVTPMTECGLHRARLIAIPTTSGTGSEATWAWVLTDTVAKRKLSTGNRELVPTVAIVDPALTAQLPPQITADTGMDVLAHAVEGYTCTWHNDFSDGLCLKAIQLVFDYLPRAVQAGAADSEARARMANAATVAGLGFGNANTALAHAMGHSLGAYLKQPHGRVVGLCLPYTIEFTLNAGLGRYADIARFAGLTDSRAEAVAGPILVGQIRHLASTIGQPTAIAALGVDGSQFEAALDSLCEHADGDTQMVTAPRMPTGDELRRLFQYAYAGRSIDF